MIQAYFWRASDQLSNIASKPSPEAWSRIKVCCSLDAFQIV